MVFVNDIFYQLEGSGVYEYVLPFLLVFSILFAILEKTQIFTGKKNVNVIVSTIVGLIFVTQFSLVAVLNNFLPKIALFMVVAVMILILFGIFGANVKEGFGGIGIAIGAIAALVAVYWALSPSLGFELPYWVQYNWDVIIVLIVILIIIALVVGGSSDETGKAKVDLNQMANTFFGKQNK